MSGIRIVGQNQTTTNSALKITNSNKITYNHDEGENQVCKAMFWGFLFSCVLVFLFILMICVRNKMKKRKQQVGYILTSISAEGSVTVWISLFFPCWRWHYKDRSCKAEIKKTFLVGCRAELKQKTFLVVIITENEQKKPILLWMQCLWSNLARSLYLYSIV